MCLMQSGYTKLCNVDIRQSQVGYSYLTWGTVGQVLLLVTPRKV